MHSIIWNIKGFYDLSAQELYKILKARQDVFIVEQNSAYQDLDGYDEKALHIWAEEHGAVIAYCRIFGKQIKYEETSIGRVISVKKFRGKNFGRQLMSYALEIIENRFGTTQVRISAQDYLLDFYKEFNFQETDKKYLEDGIPHTEMFRIQKLSKN